MNVPSNYPVVYFANAGVENCSGTTISCEGGGENPCCKVLKYGAPVTPRFWLEKQTDAGWTTVAGPQFSTVFNNVARGTYRVKCQVPTIAENACKTDAQGNVIRARICVFNELGQFLGLWGTWDNSPFGSPSPTYTNTVVVGATTADDISYTFIDPTPNDPFEQVYEFGETAKMNTAKCKDYDLWWLAIFEAGPTYQRYLSNGWTNDRVPNNEINLTSFWANGSSGWKFEVNHLYTVQFVTENSACRNGIEQNPPANWNVLERAFVICPLGVNCRTGEDTKAIAISPNPAGSSFRLLNLELDFGFTYRLMITDLTGRVLQTVALNSNEVDIAEIQNGLYAVIIEKDGKRIFANKLIVNH